MPANTTGLKKHSSWDSNELDPQEYTLSLLHKGIATGFVGEMDKNRIQEELLLLLKELLIKYTKGITSSVKTDTAEKIFGSILYSMDARLSMSSSPEDALELLKNGDIKNIYKEGQELIRQCFEKSQALYQQVVKNKLPVAQYAYNSTIDEAIAGFFRIYDPVYFAQDTCATIDYPLLLDSRDASGVFFINRYLEKLNIENIFCGYYDPLAVNKLLYNYGRIYHIDYREPIVNITEVILTNSLASVLSSNSSLNLRIDTCQYEFLTDKFKRLDSAECSALITQAVETLLNELQIDDSELKDYIRNFQTNFISRFRSAITNNTLLNLIIPGETDISSLDIKWDEGHILSDDDFRLLVAQVLQCTDGKSKADVINTNLNSLSDFIDVLEADCLFNDEYSDLYAGLGDIELSIVAKIVFAEELRAGRSGNLQDIAGAVHSSETWKIEFSQFIKELNPAKIDSIENYLKYL